MVMLAQHLWILLSWEILEDGVNAASWLPRSSSSTPSWNLSGDGCHTKSCRLSLANRHDHHALLQWCDCNEGQNHGFPHEKWSVTWMVTWVPRDFGNHHESPVNSLILIKLMGNPLSSRLSPSVLMFKPHFKNMFRRNMWAPTISTWALFQMP